MKEELKTAMI